MNVTFHDLQQPNDPLNGVSLDSANAVSVLLESLSSREPFLFELCGENGFMLTIGLAQNHGSVQYSPSDGATPYLMAVARDGIEEDGYTEYLAGNTPTPISNRFRLPISQVERIARDFVASGVRSGTVEWEEI